MSNTTLVDRCIKISNSCSRSEQKPAVHSYIRLIARKLRKDDDVINLRRLVFICSQPDKLVS